MAQKCTDVHIFVGFAGENQLAMVTFFHDGNVFVLTSPKTLASASLSIDCERKRSRQRLEICLLA